MPQHPPDGPLAAAAAALPHPLQGTVRGERDRTWVQSLWDAARGATGRLADTRALRDAAYALLAVATFLTD